MSCVLPEWKSTSSVSQGETPPPPSTLNTKTIWWCSYTSDYANTSILHILLMSRAHKQCSRGKKKNHTHTQVTHWETNWDTHCHILGGRVRDALRLLKDRWITQSVVCHRARRQEDTKQAAPDCGGILSFFFLWRPEHTLCHKCQLKKEKKKTGSKLPEKVKIRMIEFMILWQLLFDL